jgi:nucleotide-binding universal stress UspA family protein
MFRKILFPLDLSDLSRKGLAWTARNVADPTSELILVHVVEVFGGMDPGPMIHKAERSIGVIQAELSSTGIRNRSFVMAGDPFEILPEIAHAEGCSLCALFADGDDVVVPYMRLMALPHLVYKSPGGVMPPPDPFRRITVATDLSPSRTDTVFKKLRTLLAGRNVPMTILHSLFMEDTLTSTEMFQAASAALEEVRASVEKWNPGTGAEVLGGHPEVEILRRVAKIKPGMLVVGLSIHGHLWELIVGSTGEAIIERSPCPVLVIPS